MANTPNPNPSTAWTWNEFATDAPTYPWTAWPADYTWLPKAADLTDTFDTQIDPTLWPNKYGTTAWAAGQATLTERPSNYSGLVSAANAYDLSNSSIFARLTPPATMAASSETALAVYQDSSNGVWFSIINNAGVTALLVYTKIAGARVQVNRPYNPVQAAYLRIRMSGTTVYWDTSPNAIDWTNLYSTTISLPMTAVTVEISAGQWAAETTQGTATVDNINSTPPVLTGDTLTDTFPIQIDPALWNITGATWESQKARLDSALTTQKITSTNSYNLLNSIFSAQVTPPSAAPSRSTRMTIRRPNGMGYFFLIDQSPRQLSVQFQWAAPPTNPISLASFPYDPVAHAWLRFRQSNQILYFDASPDGITWTNLTNVHVVTNIYCQGQFETAADLANSGSGGSSTNSIDNTWSTQGSASVKNTPNGSSTAASYYPGNPSGTGRAMAALGLQPGKTYTVSADIKVNVTQTGTLDSAARKIAVGIRNPGNLTNYGYASSPAAPNTPGVTRLAVTFTVPTTPFEDIFIRLMNGTSVAAQTVNWDTLTIEEGTTAGVAPWSTGCVSDPGNVDLSVLQVEFSSGQTQAENGTAPAYIDNINYTPLTPAMHTLTDPFTTQIDPNLWNADRAVWENGRVRIDSVVATPSTAPRLSTDVPYDLRDSALYAQLVPPPGATSRATRLAIRRSSSTDGYFFAVASATRQLLIQSQASGTTATLSTRTYDATAHAWLRFRSQGTTLYFESSPDAVTWTTLTRLGNLYRQGSFETAADLAMVIAASGAVLSLDTSWATQGSSSLKITGGTSASSAAYVGALPNNTGDALKALGLERGKTYTFSADIKVNTVQTGTLDGHARGISIVERRNNASSAKAVSQAPNVVGVSRQKVTYTVPADVQDLGFRLMNGSSVAAQTVNWDSLLVEEGTTDGTWTPGIALRPTNLYADNPSFEDPLVNYGSGGSSINARSSVWSSQGSYSASNTPSTASGYSSLYPAGGANATYVGSAMDLLGLEWGKTYTISADFYLPKAHVAVESQDANYIPRAINVAFRQASDGTTVSPFFSAQLPNTAGAQARLKVTFTTPSSGCDDIIFRLSNGTKDPTDIIYFDALMVEEGTTPGVWSEGAIPHPTNLFTNNPSIETALTNYGTGGASIVVRSYDWASDGAASALNIPVATGSIYSSFYPAGAGSQLGVGSAMKALGLDWGQTYTVSADFYMPTAHAGAEGSAFDFLARAICVGFRPTGGGNAALNVFSAQLPNTPGARARLKLTFTTPASTAGYEDILLRLANGSFNPAETMYFDAIMVERGTTPGVWSEGYAAWRAVNLYTENPSFENPYTGDTARLYATRSAAWSSQGGYSLALNPDGINGAGSYAMPLGPMTYPATAKIKSGMLPGHTYTVSADFYQPAAQRGTLDARARTVAVVWSTGTSPAWAANISSAQAPNTAGVKTRLAVTVDIPATAVDITVLLYNGSPTYGDVVYWDALMIEEGVTPGLWAATTVDPPALSSMLAEFSQFQTAAEPDDVRTAYFDNVNALLVGMPKVWLSSLWAKKPAKVWNGTTWVQKPVKTWTGSTWKVLT